MSSVARLCTLSTILTPYRHLIGSRVYITQRNYAQQKLSSQKETSFLNCLLFKNIKQSKIFKRTKSVTVELTSEKASSKPSKAVGYWLLCCSGVTFGTIVLAGATRLTESNLSMTTKKLLRKRPPRTTEEWITEFEKYKEMPKFKYSKPDMTLKEFKTIWYMEFARKICERGLGVIFLLPATYFWSKGMLNKGIKVRIPIIGGFIAAQGLLGWYMVKSGRNSYQGEENMPHISQYQLASHLGLAYVSYAMLLWSALHHLLPPQPITNASQEAIKALKKFKLFAHVCKGMVFFTAVSGAFVAALNAGLVYNSFPKMGDKWIPDDVLSLKPVTSNFTENPVTVQLEHRILGTTTLCLISGLWLMSRRRTLPPRAYIAVNAVALMAWLQVTLGVTSLLTYVPVPIAVSHQTGSLTLLSLAFWLVHELKRARRV